MLALFGFNAIHKETYPLRLLFQLCLVLRKPNCVISRLFDIQCVVSSNQLKQNRLVVMTREPRCTKKHHTLNGTINHRKQLSFKLSKSKILNENRREGAQATSRDLNTVRSCEYPSVWANGARRKLTQFESRYTAKPEHLS